MWSVENDEQLSDINHRKYNTFKVGRKAELRRLGASLIAIPELNRGRSETKFRCLKAVFDRHSGV